MGSDAVTFLAIPPRKAVQLISENAYYSVVEGGSTYVEDLLGQRQRPPTVEQQEAQSDA